MSQWQGSLHNITITGGHFLRSGEHACFNLKARVCSSNQSIKKLILSGSHDFYTSARFNENLLPGKFAQCLSEYVCDTLSTT
jgi:hypothetical protein